MENLKEDTADNKPSTSAAKIAKAEDSDSDDSDNIDNSYLQLKTITENITEDYEELDNSLSKDKDQYSKGGKGKGNRKPKSKIPIHLKGLMGEANLRFARGEYSVAEKMCFELIRQVPLAYEPYWTLSQLYENEPIKSAQYLTIVAHLNPADVTNWTRLAQIHTDANNLRKAVTCFTRAINADPSCREYHFKRIELLEKLGKCLICFFFHCVILTEKSVKILTKFLQATSIISENAR